MQAFAALGSSCFFHNSPQHSKLRNFVLKPHCSLRKQGRRNLETSWPAISLSLFGSGFFLGPLIDGLHSRVNLVVYESGSINIGPLHTNIWVNWASELHFKTSCCCNGFFSFELVEKPNSKPGYWSFTLFQNFLMLLGSLLAWIVLLHSWIASTFLGWKGLIKDFRGKPG